MGADIIEIIGPPGIGKTTIYTAACRMWRPSFSWIYPDALLTPVPALIDFKKWTEYRVRIFLKKRASKTIPSEYGFRFAESHPALADFCWRRLSARDVYGKAEPKFRFRAAFHLYQDFSRYQAVIDADPSVPCLLNEGLLQKSFLLKDDVRAMENDIHDYLELIPLPKALIHINSDDRELIIKRLVNREKVIATHRNKHKNELVQDIARWQYMLRTIESWMVDRGVRIYHIDGARPLIENVAAITKMMNIQNHRQGVLAGGSSL